MLRTLQPAARTPSACWLSWCPGTYLEDQDCFRFSGIFREVYLLARGKERLDDIFVKSYVSDDFIPAELRIEAKLSTPCDIKYKLVAPDGVTVSEGVGGEKFSISVNSPVLWNDEQPELYELWLTVGDEIVLLDTAVRRFEIKDGICLLNGKQSRLAVSTATTQTPSRVTPSRSTI